MNIQEYKVPDDLLYDKKNYWIKMQGDEAIIGLTDYGQSTIGDILYIELEEAGKAVACRDELGSIEAGKWVGKIYAPLDGTTKEENKEVLSKPRLVNSDPYKNGWLMRLKIEDLKETITLMNSEEYKAWMDEQILREQEEDI